MEDGKVAVGIFVHTHVGLDVVVAMAACRDLQAQVLVAHRVVIADMPRISAASTGSSPL